MIEILVALMITVFLSTILITYNRAGSLQIILFKEQAKIINNVLRAKNLATQIFNQGSPVCGYGVHFDKDKKLFILFKDLANPCSNSDNRYSGSAEDLESGILDSQIKFSNLGLFDILFIPPEPIVIIDGDPAKKGDFIVEINSKSGGSPKKIKVNSFGQVSAD